ncbi:MAG: CDP-alcohol phosphatidyltransferase family protein, partial [Erysipelotrichaceae bacterium]|nr:CDP-alcohol phosphatidyltransferase family protein [Erysipelotrichaceae bacterium]
MRKNLANIITFTRILGTLCLIFLTPLTLPFFVVYIWCGLSDVLDGFVARK